MIIFHPFQRKIPENREILANTHLCQALHIGSLLGSRFEIALFRLQTGDLRQFVLYGACAGCNHNVHVDSIGIDRVQIRIIVLAVVSLQNITSARARCGGD